MSQQKDLPIAILMVVAVAVIFVGLLFSLVSWWRLGSLKAVGGKLSGYGIIAKMNVMGSKNAKDGDWSVSFTSDRDLHGCELVMDGQEADLSSIEVNTPTVNLWATHYSVRSNDIAANEKVEFGQNMDSSSFDRTVVRPEAIRLNCTEGYVEWRAE